ncbi:MAG: VWA domain-containing protein [Polyangiaceae bacterium]|nr:VWA domain-containing protein [Polyangiaceae bacterium]
MRSLWKLGAVLAGASLVVAACSSLKGDDDDNDNDNDDSGTSTGSSTGTGTGLATGSSTGTSTGGGVDTKYGLEVWKDDEQVDACQDQLQVPEPFDVILMFVVDVSKSMLQTSNTGNTKWDDTKAALQSVIDGLPDNVAMGVLYYPNMNPPPEEHEDPTDDPSACVNVDALVPPELMKNKQRQALTDSLTAVDDREAVLGGTPTYTAYTVGLAAVQESDLPGNKYVVLMTDGEPTYGVGCVGNGTTMADNIKPEFITDTQAAIEGAWDVGASDIPVGTFVIGSPGSEMTYTKSDARPWLSEAARLGGTAPVDCDDNGPVYCHFDLTDPSVNFAQGLNNALAQILGQIVACAYSPPTPPNGLDLDLSEVGIKFMDGNEDQYVVPLVTKADCNDGAQGWYWNSDKTKIRLCEETCTLVRSDARAGIQVLYGCKSIIK